ncbi:acyl-CoA N-acyltransferase [Basidiobolus meristosporus CBS 931.73]|uniref:Acyl-CoA N-acyltransferase n=1 Tax=Basidiobolus meristosporus CBS 931.73 TaxID=1314790 RepID=A0A1Y1YSV2_9FUNG|nr:acyl-CoA N-acyltransferase [Basidiobolus meristosporus CBS 931.73]|eukprot:ORY00827.1 acyl-CoA N-acyltransferase [Basidiobolus meristosporus CBS 931.73]
MSEENFTFVNTSEYSLKELVEVNNRAWKGYFRDMTIDVAGLSGLVKGYDVDLARGVVMLNEAKLPIGLTNLGVRGKEGWVAGFAIDPDYRKKGLGQLLMKELISQANALEIATLHLECMLENTSAYKLYTHIGFLPCRKLYSFHLGVKELLAEECEEEQVFETPISWTNAQWTSNHMSMCWPRQAFTTRIGNHTVVSIKDSFGLPKTGLLVKCDGKEVLILDSLITAHSTTQDFARILKSQVQSTTEKIQIFNEPEESPFLRFLEQMGFQSTLTQWEMSLKLQSVA